MDSIALDKVVLLDEAGNICMCDKQFCKACSVRIASDLPCKESIVRITYVDRSYSEEDFEDASFKMVKTFDKELLGVKNALAKTLSHIDKMRK